MAFLAFKSHSLRFETSKISNKITNFNKYLVMRLSKPEILLLEAFKGQKNHS